MQGDNHTIGKQAVGCGVAEVYAKIVFLFFLDGLHCNLT